MDEEAQYQEDFAHHLSHYSNAPKDELVELLIHDLNNVYMGLKAASDWVNEDLMPETPDIAAAKEHLSIVLTSLIRMRARMDACSEAHYGKKSSAAAS